MMIDIFIKWGVLSATLMASAMLMKGVTIRSWRAAIMAAATFGFANVILGWLLTFMLKVVVFLPSLLTFGLLGLCVPVVVNMVLLKIADNLTGDGLEVDGLSTLFGLSAAVTASSAVTSWMLVG